MSTIFISHSSKDNSIAEELKHHLEMQGYRSVFLDFDPDMGIPPGRDWEHELYHQLRTCQAVIVLCSEYSMSSRWCFVEITHAKSLGKHVFPVKIGPCKIVPVLTSRQIIDLTQNKESAYQRLWRGLKIAGLDPADSFDWDYSRSPYPGMMAFQEEDAAVFFGREEEIQQGLETLQRLHQFGGAQMLLVLGASGSGKSSLVRAGLLPRLRRNPELWLIVDPFRPQDYPLRELAIVLAEAFSVSHQKRNWKDICEQLEQASRSEESQKRVFLNDLALDLQIARKQREAKTLLIIDQAEELLVRSEEQKTVAFLFLLRFALDVPSSTIMAIFTLRSDFLGDFQRQQGLLGLSREHFPVGPMAKDHLAKIIEGPARIADIDLEDGLTETMVRDTESQDALPLLAFTLRELYEHYGDDKLLEIHEYREKLGGLNGAVARAADAVLAATQLLTEQEEDLKTAFVSLARINEEGQFTRQPVRWSDMPESVHGVLESFVQARLLISRGEGKERLLEAAHEALFQSWGRLKGWLDEDREFLLWRKRFKEARREWLRTGCEPGALLAGPTLVEGKGWLERRAKQLAPKEIEYFEKSIHLEKKRRNRRLGAIAGMVLFLIAVAIGGIVLWQRAEKQASLAQRQAEKAKERAIMAEATLRWSPFDLNHSLRDREIEGLLMITRDDKAIKRAFIKQLIDEAALAEKFSRHPKAITRAVAGLDTAARDWLIQEFLVTPRTIETNLTIRAALGFLGAELEADEGFHHLLETIQDITDSDQREALGKALAALPVKLLPALAEPAVTKLVAAIQDTTKPDQLETLGKTLAALTAKLSPALTEPAATKLVAAIQNTTNSDQLKALGKTLAALAAKLSPTAAEPVATKLVAAMQNTTNSDRLEALGKALAALPVKLSPAAAEPVVTKLVAAMQNTTYSYQLEAQGKALAALAAKLSPAAAEPVATKLVAAMQNATYSDQLEALGKALAALPVKLSPAAAEPVATKLVAAMQNTTNSDQLKALGKTLAALTAKLSPAAAEPVVTKLVAAMQNATYSDQREALGKALAALTAKLSPAVAEPVATKLVAAMQNTTNSYQLETLGKALAALPVKLSPAAAEPAVTKLVAAMQNTTNSYQLKALGKALAALAAKLSPTAAEPVVTKLVAAIQNSTYPYQCEALGKALAALAAKLSPAAVEPVVTELVAAIQNTTYSDRLEALGKALAALPVKLSPAAAEPVATKLVAAIQNATNSYQLKALGKTLAALPVKLSPAAAEPAVTKLVAAIQNTTYSDRLEAQGKALAALAAKLSPAVAEPVATKLVAAIQNATNSYQLEALWKALAALPVKLSPAVAEPAVTKLVAAIQNSTYSDQCEALGKDLAALAAKLSPAAAEPVATKLVAAMQNATNSDQLEALGKALAALAAKLPPALAKPAVTKLVAAIQNSTYSFQLETLGKTLDALTAELSPAVAEPVATELVAAMKVTTNSDQLGALGEALAALAAKLSDDRAFAALVFEILK